LILATLRLVVNTKMYAVMIIMLVLLMDVSLMMDVIT